MIAHRWAWVPVRVKTGKGDQYTEPECYGGTEICVCVKCGTGFTNAKRYEPCGEQNEKADAS